MEQRLKSKDACFSSGRTHLCIHSCSSNASPSTSKPDDEMFMCENVLNCATDEWQDSNGEDNFMLSYFQATFRWLNHQPLFWNQRLRVPSQGFLLQLRLLVNRKLLFSLNWIFALLLILKILWMVETQLENKAGALDVTLTSDNQALHPVHCLE